MSRMCAICVQKKVFEKWIQYEHFTAKIHAMNSGYSIDAVSQPLMSAVPQPFLSIHKQKEARGNK